MSQYLRNLKKANINSNCLRLVTTAQTGVVFQSTRSRYSLCLVTQKKRWVTRHFTVCVGDCSVKVICPVISENFFFLTRMKTLT